MPEREPDAVEQELEATAGFRASVSLLRRNRDFRRLFLASVISLGGDWFLFVAITSLIVETTGTAIDVGLAILAQELAFFLASPLGGRARRPARSADADDRAATSRASASAPSFLLVGPGTIWLAYPLLAVLSVFGAAVRSGVVGRDRRTSSSPRTCRPRTR